MPTAKGLDPADLPDATFLTFTLAELSASLGELLAMGYPGTMPVKIGVVTPGHRGSQLYVARIALAVGLSDTTGAHILQLLIPAPPGYTPPPAQPQN